MLCNTGSKAHHVDGDYVGVTVGLGFDGGGGDSSNSSSSNSSKINATKAQRGKRAR